MNVDKVKFGIPPHAEAVFLKWLPFSYFGLPTPFNCSQNGAPEEGCSKAPSSVPMKIHHISSPGLWSTHQKVRRFPARLASVAVESDGSEIKRCSPHSLSTHEASLSHTVILVWLLRLPKQVSLQMSSKTGPSIWQNEAAASDNSCRNGGEVLEDRTTCATRARLCSILQMRN